MKFRDFFRRFFKQKKPGTDLVRYYDIENQRVVQIPASELAPGVVQIQIVGMEGIVWIEASKLSHGEVKHPPFNEEVRELIHQIHNTFKDHSALSFDEWEDGFRRDNDPMTEIALWSHAAEVYSAFAEDELSIERRNEIYRCIVTCLTTSPDTVWHVFKPDVLSQDDANLIVEKFYGRDAS